MEGVPDDEISLSVLLVGSFYYNTKYTGVQIFVVLGLSFLVAVGMASWAGVGDHRWKRYVLMIIQYTLHPTKS
jgi:hypothetical protein